MDNSAIVVSSRKGDENQFPQSGPPAHAPQGGNTAGQSLNNSVIVGSEKPQPGIFSRQGTQNVPQIQFQVNVSTVEYKYNK